jgi:hypothetical protein
LNKNFPKWIWVWCDVDEIWRYLSTE